MNNVLIFVTEIYTINIRFQIKIKNSIYHENFFAIDYQQA